MEARIIKTDSIINGYYFSWQLEFIEQFGSEQETKDSLWLTYTPDGVSCEDWINVDTNVELNDTLILNLVKKYEEDNHFFLPYCTNASFHVKNNMVNGSVNGYSYTDIEYSTFKEYLKGNYVNDYNCVECSCYSCGASINPYYDYSTFCSSLKRSGNSRIGLYEILDKSEHFLVAQPIDCVFGNTSICGWENTNEPITIWGNQNNSDCRKSLETFNVGNQYILNLSILESYERTSSEQKEGDLELLDCGIVSLIFEDGLVKGIINSELESIPYNEFKHSFSNGDFYLADDCGWTMTNLNSNIDKEDINIYPNPARNYFSIDCEKEFNLIGLFDTAGNRFQVEQNSKNTFDVSVLHSGIYFLKVQIKDRIIKKKLVVLK